MTPKKFIEKKGKGTSFACPTVLYKIVWTRSAKNVIASVQKKLLKSQNRSVLGILGENGSTIYLNGKYSKFGFDRIHHEYIDSCFLSNFAKNRWRSDQKDASSKLTPVADKNPAVISAPQIRATTQAYWTRAILSNILQCVNISYLRSICLPVPSFIQIYSVSEGTQAKMSKKIISLLSIKI